jgi:hypothetical protein
MSKLNRNGIFNILALIGAGTATIYVFKLFFWVLLYIMTHPVETLCAWVGCGVVYYVGKKVIKQ